MPWNVYKGSSFWFKFLFSAVSILRCKALARLFCAIRQQSDGYSRREPLVHEWSPSLNEQELTPVLPSNRETGCLSNTQIKMDALYFLPCSVREQDKRRVKEEEEKEERRWGNRGGWWELYGKEVLMKSSRIPCPLNTVISENEDLISCLI